MILEDIPIFCKSRNEMRGDDFWWGFTGRSRRPPVSPDLHCHRVYFTKDFLDCLAWRQIGGLGGPWELSPTSDGTMHHWFVKHRSSYVWQLHHNPDLEGYILGVWPD